jgi:putative (di)nucleoside polyphosphate hydrolase
VKDPESLPYRPCVGVMLVNRAGLAFVGRRRGGQEPIGEDHAWQMPQGGIDDGEEPYAAALRELYEETSVRSVEPIGETSGWVKYDLPRELVGVAWKGRYRGQTQKWFALRFTGEDSEIDVLTPGNGKHKAEFSDWRWEEIGRLPSLIVPFKRASYGEVVAELQPLVAA